MFDWVLNTPLISILEVRQVQNIVQSWDILKTWLLIYSIVRVVLYVMLEFERPAVSNYLFCKSSKFIFDFVIDLNVGFVAIT